MPSPTSSRHARMQDRSNPAKQLCRKVGISGDPAIAIDDAGELAPARPDRRQDRPDARLAIARHDAELDRQIEASQRFGFRGTVHRDGLESGRRP